ncbi:MAG: response regulator [Limimaricola sp.]|uniref:response regulator n=1 Tax=Limimaricola sp. TaxID=2211665 RepID=UPI001D68334F|nr:response regulator [Limimaricola sp.]MBI1416917.1 response regulator [Limimaricola sp.]
MLLETLAFPKAPASLKRDFAVSAFAVLAISVFIALFTAASLQGSLNSNDKQIENTTWIVSQLEVDQRNLELAVTDALMSGISTDAQLNSISRFFDIYYSRVETVTSYLHKLPPDFKGLKRINSAAARVEVILQDQAAAIVELRHGEIRPLAALLESLRSERPLLRSIAVDSMIGNNIATNSAISAQETLTRRFTWLAMLVIVFLSAVGLLSILAYRRIKRHSQTLDVITNGLQRAADAALNAIFILDAEGRILATNHAAEELSGFRPKDLLGKNAVRLFHRKTDLPKTAAHTLFHTALKRGQVRFLARDRSGRMVPIEFSIVKLQGAAWPQSYIAFAHGISDARSVRRRLRAESFRAREDANRKAALLGDIAHELLTPLQGIVASLSRGSSDKGSAAPNLQVAWLLSQIMLDQIEQVTRVSDHDKATWKGPEPAYFDPKVLIAEAVAGISELCEDRGLRIVLKDKVRGPITLQGHASDLAKALRHVLLGVVKATREGEVRVHLSQVGGKNLRVSVEASHGGGLDGWTEPAMVSDLSRDDKRRECLPLGMSIVRDAVQALGGTLGRSADGHGRLVWRLDLPIADAAGREPVSGPPTAPAQKELRVLLVEDDPINRTLIANMIRQNGSTVIEAADGQEAVDRATLDRYDLIIMDLNLPRLDGVSAIRLIRTKNCASRNATIFGLTANRAGAEIANFGDVTEGVLLKPVTLGEIGEVLAQAGRRGAQPHSPREPKAGAEIAELTSILGPARLHEVIDDLSTSCSQIRTAIDKPAGDVVSLRELAHKCAGTAAVLGLSPLHGLLCEIEDACTATSQALNGAQCSDWKQRLTAHMTHMAELQDMLAAPAGA